MKDPTTIDLSSVPASPGERDLAQCPCPKTTCRRHGDCRACKRHVRKRGDVFCRRCV